ncbi:MAG: tetratricopeptide repeat protein [Gammaproteobacteria bacterium]
MSQVKNYFYIGRISCWILTLVLMHPMWCFAEIDFKLTEPHWTFLLQNQPWGETEAQLDPSESRFARSIQPLLAAQRHAAVLQAFEKRPIDQDSAALRLLRGQVLLSLKRYDESEKALQAALQALPDLALAHRSLSAVYVLKKQYKQAQKHLVRSLELGVADAQVYGQLAYVNVQLGQTSSAVAGYQYALLLEPNNTQFEELLQADPKNANLWLQRGQLALNQKRTEQAIASLETAMHLGKKNTNTLVTAAQLHIQSGSARRAVDLLTGRMSTLIKAGKIDVVDQIAAWLVFQEEWQSLNQLLRALDRTQTSYPSNYASRFAFYRAQVALANQKSQSARKYLLQAINSDASNGEALLALAKLWREQNRSEQAVMYYLRAEALPIFKERALLGRAQVEIDRQNYTEALRLLRVVAQANPRRRDVLSNIQSLENLVQLSS